MRGDALRMGDRQVPGASGDGPVPGSSSRASARNDGSGQSDQGPALAGLHPVTLITIVAGAAAVVWWTSRKLDGEAVAREALKATAGMCVRIFAPS